MEATDQLLCYLQSLDECLTLKRLILQEECKLLNSLLLPWKGHKESKTSVTPVLAENIKPAAVDVVKEEILDPIDEELAKVNKLLEKVYKVRSNVKDDEVRVMCKIESSVLPDKLPEIAKGATIDSSAIRTDTGRNQKVPNRQREVTKPLSANKQTRNSISSRFKPTKAATQTSYQSSYKPPSSRQVRGGGQVTSKIASRPKSDTTAASHKASGDLKSGINVTDQTRMSKVVNNTTSDKASPIPSIVTKGGNPSTGASNLLSEQTPHPEASLEMLVEKFTLKKNGKELKVPKSMRAQMKLQQEFRAKADYILHQTSTSPVLPDKLRRYYIASENIPVK